jgi:O-antigen/teichoic acid export membrane protein
MARNAAFAFAVQMTTAAFTAGLTLYLVRALEPAGYGIFSLAVGVGALLLLPSDFGVSPSAARFVAEHRSDRSSVTAVLAGALRLKFLATVVVCGALFLAADPVSNAYEAPGLAWPLRAVAIALFGQNLMMLFGGAFTAMGRVSVNLRLVLSESAVETVASLALVLLGGGVAGAAFGRAAGYAFGGLVAIGLTVRMLGWPSVDIRRRAGSRLNEVARYASALLAVDAAFTLFDQIDVLIIGALVGTAGVGLFQAPMRLVTFLHYPGYAIASGVAPRLARTKDRPPRIDAFRHALRFLIILQAALLAPVLVWAEPIVSLLLGPEYRASAGVLRALAPFVFLSGIAPIVSLTVNYLGDARRRIPIAVLTVLVNLGVDLALVPRIGIVGGALGTDLAYAIYVPGHLWICRSMLGISLIPFAPTLARSLAAALAMGLVLASFGTANLSLLDWFGGGLAGTAVFAVTLLATREISLTDLRSARRLVLERLRGADA